MKKYFMQGTADELNIGDQIKLDLTEDLPDGKVRHHHIDCKFIPDLIPMLLESKVIEEQEVKEPEPANEDPIAELEKASEALALRVNELEDIMRKVIKLITIPILNGTKDTKPHGNARKAGRKQKDKERISFGV